MVAVVVAAVCVATLLVYFFPFSLYQPVNMVTSATKTQEMEKWLETNLTENRRGTRWRRRLVVASMRHPRLLKG